MLLLEHALQRDLSLTSGQQVTDPVSTSPEPTDSDNGQSLPSPSDPALPPSQPQQPNVSWNVDRYVVREERFDESKS